MTQPLTILHLVSLMGLGGRCATALRQARLLAERGHRVLVGCIAGSAAAERPPHGPAGPRRFPLPARLPAAFILARLPPAVGLLRR